jgi:hypothetical protein
MVDDKDHITTISIISDKNDITSIISDKNDIISIISDKNDFISTISNKNDIISIISDENDTIISIYGPNDNTIIDNSNITSINHNRESSSIMVIPSSAVFWLWNSLRADFGNPQADVSVRAFPWRARTNGYLST